jgi:hypothetical protein
MHCPTMRTGQVLEGRLEDGSTVSARNYSQALYRLLV